MSGLAPEEQDTDGEATCDDCEEVFDVAFSETTATPATEARYCPRCGAEL